ncbi:MAG TPA: FG-GAP-like repeat-containing protein [Pyrinomonadaceae bacterium]|nr:FG-GAP-like repeat-containing protein [Pyrinomonadaceae bacterium]
MSRRLLPPFRTRPAQILLKLSAIVALVACGGLVACRREASLPAQSSGDYTAAVRAFYVGLAALQVGDDVRAEAKLTEATTHAPEEPAVWADLALLYLRQRQFERAAEKLEKARQLAPENSGIYVLLGQLESSRGNYAEAIRQFRRATETDARNLKALYALAGEVEREAGEGSEQEVLRLLQRILEVQPDNLSVQLDVARLAARGGDAELFARMTARFDERSAKWPAEAREQLKAVESAAAQSGVRAAAPRVQFLRNVLVRLPEYRQSRLAVQDPPEILSEPFTRFLRLASPSPSPAPHDDALAFEAQPVGGFDAGDWNFGGAVYVSAEGAPTLLFANGREARLASGVRLPFPGGAKGIAPGANAVVALDFDYDFKPDLALAGEGGFRLYRQENSSTFVDVTARTKLAASVVNAPYAGAWAADIEADGDLDVVLAARDAEPFVARNNGDGTFAAQHPFSGAAAVRDFAWADFDGDGDPDAATLDATGRLNVYTNERTGQFDARPAPQHAGQLVALGVADVNSDGRFDLLAMQTDGALQRFSDRDEGAGWETAEVLRWEGAPVLQPGGVRLSAADLDNNGGIDLLASTPAGAHAWLSDAGGGFRALKLSEELSKARAVAVADADGDGRLDLIAASGDGRAFTARGRGAKSYHWQLIRPRAANATGDQRINSFGVGGEMEIRSGLLVQKQLIAGPVVHFGLGEQTGADVVRVVWPNGSVRAEFELKADQSVLAEQRLKGSCPSLFAFDGRRMNFVKDCAPWSPAIGLRINNYQTAKVTQTEEWVKIDGRQLAPREGFYDLRITAELWETYYLDRYQLAVVDHPEGTEVFVDERTARNPPALKVYTVSAPRPFARASDDEGRDVGNLVATRDGRHLDTFGRGSYQGLTRDHFVELELGDDAPREGALWLVAHGWLHPTDASINVAVSQGSHAPPAGLSLEVADGRGGWRVVRPDLGFPSGKNKTILVDLKDVFTQGAPRRLRLRTNMEIYWDALTWARGMDAADVTVTRLDPDTAELRYRGFSEMRRADASSPETPVYEPVASTAPRWRDLVGYYTRFGDVRELLSATDDRIVIANAGDELLLRFAARPAPAAGRVRDYVLIGNGWIKDGDYNSMFSKTVLPLPSRDRQYYTTAPTRLEDDPVYRRHPQDWQDYHTRYVTPQGFSHALRTK